MRTKLNLLSLSLLVVLGLAACSTGGAKTNAEPSQSLVQSVRPTPAHYCLGATNYADAKTVVDTSGAVLMVSATVASDPSKDPANAHSAIASVNNVKVLAGEQSNGALETIMLPVEASQASIMLPLGDFVLILAAVPDRPSVYALSNGLNGTFEYSGDTVTQRCANFEDPKHPKLASTSVSLEALTGFVAKAIEVNGPVVVPTLK